MSSLEFLQSPTNKPSVNMYRETLANSQHFRQVLNCYFYCNDDDDDDYHHHYYC